MTMRHDAAEREEREEREERRAFHVRRATMNDDGDRDHVRYARRVKEGESRKSPSRFRTRCRTCGEVQMANALFSRCEKCRTMDREP